ncbi:uncharacterized protein LOC129603812 isoform X1 [Betta splendens]|uniref:Uncharacterized protein LOC129603812 isoform X1 n=1 Tax=Betta splendens TaxID=158456 RepID=A0A9W2XLZ6_BETSP|nr:uncharacterized protein LOC129603812 isoform X1 [Betta splendens]
MSGSGGTRFKHLYSKMKATIITPLLLCGLSYVSVSDSEFRTVDIRSGVNLSLLCSNFSSSPTQIIWFKLYNRTQPRCISYMYSANEPASFCGQHEQSKFEATSNVSTLFFKIKHVDASDSGLYFCGYYINKHSVIVSSTYLHVQGMVGALFYEDVLSQQLVYGSTAQFILSILFVEESGEETTLMTLILSTVTVVVTKVIVVLVVRKGFQSGAV